MSRLVFDFPPHPGASPVRRIFRDPVEVLRATDVAEVEPALARVRRAVREDRLSAAGYLAYEAAPAFDPAFRVRPGAEAPLLWFGLYEGSGAPVTSPPASPSARDGDRTRASVPTDPAGSAHATDPFGSWTLDVTREAFTESVARIHDAIEAGETYQVNWTTRMRSSIRDGASREGLPGADDLDRHERVYERLRRSQGDGYHALLELDDQTLVSASPELFFQIREREVTVRPMKGTRPRGRWLEEDEALARELRGSEKEQAENRMIVDLLRNDLGRVAEVGTVRVPRVFDVERYRTVLQMTSTVTGTLPPGADFLDVLRALFPSGSVTGAPKIQTMKLISELESSPREAYCGAIGYVEGGSGDAVFNVPIRTLRIDRASGTAAYGTGSGITWGSTAEEEYEEIRAKARILSERWPAFDLLETLRLEGGTLLRLERHVARMRRSAAYFDRPFPEEAVRRALGETAREHPTASRKVRLTLSETEEIRITAKPIDDGGFSFEATIDGVTHPAVTSRGSSDRGSDGRSGAAADPRPRPVALATTPVDSSDRFLFHKTTHRDVYDSHRSGRPDMFDVLLWNEEDELTEFTIGNVVVEMAGRRLTPPRSCGLLAGCFRGELLERGLVAEERITREALDRADRIWLINSVRGWVPVTLENDP